MKPEKHTLNPEQERIYKYLVSCAKTESNPLKKSVPQLHKETGASEQLLHKYIEVLHAKNLIMRNTSDQWNPIIWVYDENNNLVK